MVEARQSATATGSIAFLPFIPAIGRMADRAVAILIAYVALSSMLRATGKPFWTDEIITVTLVRLPSVRAIWGALENGADSQPPTFYLFERLAAHLPIDELIAFRIPSILAFSCLVLCVFLFIRRLRGRECALICAAIPLLSVLLYPYAVEARGYSLMTGFAALAMVSYQRAHKPSWCLLLALSLIAATASHYYAVFAAFPFALAELALLVQQRRLRVSVWIALLLSVLPMLLFWRLLQAYKNIYGSHFIGHLSPLAVLNSYAFLWRLPASFAVGMTVAAVAAISLYGFLSGKESLTANCSTPPCRSTFSLWVLSFYPS
jgi:4-amino-4-deoxy-L-arabinose transferase-like glycosyltransferase